MGKKSVDNELFYCYPLEQKGFTKRTLAIDIIVSCGRLTVGAQLFMLILNRHLNVVMHLNMSIKSVRVRVEIPVQFS